MQYFFVFEYYCPSTKTRVQHTLKELGTANRDSYPSTEQGGMGQKTRQEDDWGSLASSLIKIW